MEQRSTGFYLARHPTVRSPDIHLLIVLTAACTSQKIDLSTRQPKTVISGGITARAACRIAAPWVWRNCHNSCPPVVTEPSPFRPHSDESAGYSLAGWSPQSPPPLPRQKNRNSLGYICMLRNASLSASRSPCLAERPVAASRYATAARHRQRRSIPFPPSLCLAVHFLDLSLAWGHLGASISTLCRCRLRC